MLHGIHCIHSGSISQRCIESTSLNLDAWNPLHSICINYTMLQGIHCIQSGSIGPSCMQSTAFTLHEFHTAALNPVHSITLHGIHCIQSVSILPSCMESASFNGFTLHHLHRIHCIQSCFMEFTAFNWDPLVHTAWTPLHSLGIHFTTLHGIHSIES